MEKKQNITKQDITKKLPLTFVKRLDFYWQSISFYALALIIYSVLRGSIDDWTVSIMIYDPIVGLLVLFIVLSAIALLWKYFKNVSLIIGKDFMIFKSRFSEEKYSLKQIRKIYFGMEKALQMKNFIRVIKIRIEGRRRVIRIRPSSYWNEKDLTLALAHIKSKLGKNL